MCASPRTGRRLAAQAVAAVVGLGLFTGCGGDSAEKADSASETVTVTATPETDQDDAATDSPSPTQTPSAPTTTQPPRAQLFSGLPPRPGQDECVDVGARANGRYTVYEAGTAVVRRTGPRLVVGKVTPARGWQSRVDDRDSDEVEIEFRKVPRNELDLEVELDDGRVEVQICADDD